LLAGYFFYYNSAFCFLWILGLFSLAWFIYRDAFKNQSFYFLLLVILYSYIAVSSLAARVFMQVHDEGALYLMLLYFIGSGIGLILFLVKLNKKLKTS
jgi:hypothetical protein